MASMRKVTVRKSYSSLNVRRRDIERVHAYAQYRIIMTMRSVAVLIAMLTTLYCGFFVVAGIYGITLGHMDYLAAYVLPNFCYIVIAWSAVKIVRVFFPFIVED